MTDEQLAGAVGDQRREAARRAKETGRKPPSYYLLNVNHPAIAGMYRAWRTAHGLSFAPPSDRERTLFEIEMLSPEGRALLEKQLEEKV